MGGIAELFEENFARFGELGASVCIARHGEQVFNLAGGFCDRERKTPWTSKTPVLIWSATKGLASACLIHAAWTHDIHLDRKVADLWPEYGEGGKADTTLLQILTHQAGQPALRDPAISILDHEAVVAQLARQQPLWRPVMRMVTMHEPTAFFWMNSSAGSHKGPRSEPISKRFLQNRSASIYGSEYRTRSPAGSHRFWLQGRRANPTPRMRFTMPSRSRIR